jgi:putative lipoic acid-binding regulatory protein
MPLFGEHPVLKIAMPLPTEQGASLIEYPSDFPIKIMGAMHDDFAQTMVELVILHDPEFHAGKMEMRPSSKGTYLALTVTVRATSREQLDNLYRALSSHPMVKVVL